MKELSIQKLYEKYPQCNCKIQEEIYRDIDILRLYIKVIY